MISSPLSPSRAFFRLLDSIRMNQQDAPAIRAEDKRLEQSDDYGGGGKDYQCQGGTDAERQQSSAGRGRGRATHFYGHKYAEVLNEATDSRLAKLHQ